MTVLAPKVCTLSLLLPVTLLEEEEEVETLFLTPNVQYNIGPISDAKLAIYTYIIDTTK